MTGSDSNDDEITSWGLGGKVGFGAITVSGGYAYLENVESAGSEQKGWTAAVNYSGGKWETTLLFVTNELESGGVTDEYQEVHLQGAYNLGGGLTVSGGVILFDLDAGTAANDHDGTVFVTALNARF